MNFGYTDCHYLYMETVKNSIFSSFGDHHGFSLKMKDYSFLLISSKFKGNFYPKSDRTYEKS